MPTETEAPLFSIIIPAYNRAWCIERAIQSVLAQDFQDWELIIVDDGSTDDTREIVKRYLVDSRIKYFYKENGGVGSARNCGMRSAEGEIIMFLDSDDEFVAGALNTISGAVTKYADKKIYSFRAIDQNQRQVSYADMVQGDRATDFVDFLKQRYIKGETFLVYRRPVLLGKYFDEDVNGGEGLLLFSLIKENGLMMINEDARIYHTESADSLISSRLTGEKMRNTARIQEHLIDRYADDLKKNNRRYLGTAYLVLARALALSERKMASLKYFRTGCLYNIFDIKRIILYVISLFDYDLRINNVLNSIGNKLSRRE